MILFDVNVLIAAYQPEQRHHDTAQRLLERVASGPEPFGLSELVLSAFVRISTNPRVLKRPVDLFEALEIAEELLAQPNARSLRPGPRHWTIFADLCRRTQARGSLVADAHHAALAIEHGCEWISFDRDFAKFPRLRWRHPLD